MIDEPRTVFWQTKDGRRLAVAEMETAHLINALHMLQRLERMRIWRDAFMTLGYACSASTPDGAAYYAEQEADQMMEESFDPTACWEALLERDHRARAMHYELNRRGQNVFDPRAWKQG